MRQLETAELEVAGSGVVVLWVAAAELVKAELEVAEIDVAVSEVIRYI